MRGLRPVRAARAAFSKVPKPVMPTFSPFATARVMVSMDGIEGVEAAAFFPTEPVLESLDQLSSLFTASQLQRRMSSARTPRPARIVQPARRPGLLQMTLGPGGTRVQHLRANNAMCRNGLQPEPPERASLAPGAAGWRRAQVEAATRRLPALAKSPVRQTFSVAGASSLLSAGNLARPALEGGDRRPRGAGSRPMSSSPSSSRQRV